MNNKIIIAKVAVEWNRKINKISTKMTCAVFHAYTMWITHLNFAVSVYKNIKEQNLDGIW